MPVPSKSRYPLESFDPRLRDIWLTAIRQPVEIELSTTRLAIALQNRLQQYRAAVKREAPDDARMLYRAKCTRDGRKLLVTRQDSEFSDVLEQLDSQLIVRSPSELPSRPVAHEPIGPEATPLPAPDGHSSGLAFSDLFSGITVTHIQEDEDE